MKFFILAMALFLSHAAFADQCTAEGKSRSETYVKDQIKFQFNNATKVKIYSMSMVSNVYSTGMICTYEVISTFEVSNSKGKAITYLGRDVFGNGGARPMEGQLGEARDL